MLSLTSKVTLKSRLHAKSHPLISRVRSSRRYCTGSLAVLNTSVDTYLNARVRNLIYEIVPKDKHEKIKDTVANQKVFFTTGKNVYRTSMLIPIANMVNIYTRVWSNDSLVVRWIN